MERLLGVGLTNQNNSHLCHGLPEWAKRPLIKKIFTEATALGGEARIVGGAVRDWVAGYSIGDIDMAVNLPINELAAKMTTQNVQVLKTGLNHGTITLYDQNDSIEVTQTRVDLKTDGRHAVVAYEPDWASDAVRRDFTINAIYMDKDGVFFDPLDGLKDLKRGRLRFAGDAGERIQEDALRIIRYCRFWPRFSECKIDQKTQNILRKHANLCKGLSGERLANEFRRIMVGGSLEQVTKLMRRTNIDQAALGIKFNSPLRMKSKEIYKVLGQFDWLTCLTALVPAGSSAFVANRLRLSRKEQRRFFRLDAGISSAELACLNGESWKQTAYCLGDWKTVLYVVQSLRNNTIINVARCSELAFWTLPQNPICGTDLLSHGVDNGLRIGQMLRSAESRWVSSNFTLEKSELLHWLLTDWVESHDGRAGISNGIIDCG